MKPSFALNLSLDGISLLHRAGKAWINVGDVSIDSTDLAAELAMLRKSAANLSPAGITSKLVLPQSQVLYTSIDDPGGDDTARHEAIQQALDGATPYTLDEITYDWRLEDGQIRIAAVANETLDEAEAFASEHRFNPVSFVAEPKPGEFPGEPFFGPAKGTTGLLPEGETVEPEDARAEPAETAPPPVDVDAEPDTADTQAEVVAAPEQTPPSPEPSQFVSRRERDAPDTHSPRISQTPARIDLGSGAAALGGVKREVETTHVPITSPVLADQDDAPVVKPNAKPKKQGTPRGVLPEPPPMPSKGPQILAATPSSDAAEPDKPQGLSDPVAPRSADEAEALTVFGARKPKTAIERRGPKHLGVILTAILLVCLALVFAFTGLGGDDNAVNTPDAEQVQTGAISTPQPEEPRDTASLAPDAATSTSLPSASPVATPVELPPPPASSPSVDVEPPLPSPEAPPAETVDSVDPGPPAATETARVTDDPDRTVQDAVAPEAAANPRVERLADGPSADTLDDVYIASIDPQISGQDAVALPQQRNADGPPALPSTPASRAAEYDFDENGLVRATRQGAPTPEGAIIVLGRPNRVPAPRPDTAIAARTQEVQTAVADAEREALSDTTPVLRPSDLIEQQERNATGGYSMTELAQILPKPRPADLADRAAQVAATRAAAEASAQAAAAAAQAASAASLVAPNTAQTVEPIRIASGLAAARPAARPSNFAAIVERARANSQASGATSGTGNSRALLAAAAPRAPSVPTTASVARQATTRNAINLNRLNLIGVYGSNQERRALVRLPSGRYEKVKIGDRLDGGRVRAIGKDDLTYTKNGRDVTLEVKG